MMPAAYRLLPAVCCQQPTASSTAYYLLHTVSSLLPAACIPLSAFYYPAKEKDHHDLIWFGHPTLSGRGMDR
jgi:hypothetical protein